MIKSKWFSLVFACFVSASAFLALDATAHPHEWIDIRTKVIFNDEGKIEKLHQDWLLDEYSTAYTMEGMDPADQAVLDELAATIVGNLEEFSYLTHFGSATEDEAGNKTGSKVQTAEK